jgi:hypothetical protein
MLYHAYSKFSALFYFPAIIFSFRGLHGKLASLNLNMLGNQN